jgi:CRP/FNR family transcriptional regulator, cyclic AMP receptor protein
VDQSPRTAGAFAQEESELLAINRASLLALVKNQPAFGMALLRAVADRLRYMNSLLA